MNSPAAHSPPPPSLTLERALAAAALPALLALGGCAAGTLPDEISRTMAETRPSTVKSSEKLAETAERLPRTLDELNRILAAGAKTTDEAREAERTLADAVSRVASSTAVALDRVSALVATIDRASASAAAVLEDARVTAEATRADRARIVAHVEAVSAAAEKLLARLESTTQKWQEREQDLRVHEDRAAKALADLAEATARATEDVARITSAASSLARSVEPELRSSAKSSATILADVAKITDRLSSQDTSVAAWSTGASVLGGALGAAVVVALVVLVRGAFRRAVETAVRERLRYGQDRAESS